SAGSARLPTKNVLSSALAWTRLMGSRSSAHPVANDAKSVVPKASRRKQWAFIQGLLWKRRLASNSGIVVVAPGTRRLCGAPRRTAFLGTVVIFQCGSPDPHVAVLRGARARDRGFRLAARAPAARPGVVRGLRGGCRPLVPRPMAVPQRARRGLGAVDGGARRAAPAVRAAPVRGDRSAERAQADLAPCRRRARRADAGRGPHRARARGRARRRLLVRVRPARGRAHGARRARRAQRLSRDSTA